VRNTGMAHAPDLVLVVDPMRFYVDWKKLFGQDCITAFYAIDSHLDDSRRLHITWARAHEYDYLFVAQKNYLEFYKRHGAKKVHWLPLACDPEIHRKYNTPIKYDISFVGNVLGDRPLYLNKLKEEFPRSFIGRAYLRDMALIYSASKIVFNRSLNRDLNMRIFETMSCGRLLMTDFVQGLDEFFKDKVHLVTYFSLEDLIDKVKYYLEHEQEREEIAMRGMDEVHSKHTYLHRVREILKVTRIIN